MEKKSLWASTCSSDWVTGLPPQQWLSHSSHLTHCVSDASWAAIVAALIPFSKLGCTALPLWHIQHILSISDQLLCGSSDDFDVTASPHFRLQWRGLIYACYVFRPCKNQRSKWHWGEIEWGRTTTEECDQHAVQGQPFSLSSLWKICFKRSNQAFFCFLDPTVFQVRGDADLLWALAIGPGAAEWQSAQNSAVHSESNQDIR